VITPERLPRVRPYRSRKKFWTRRERAQFLADLGRYSIVSSYVAALLLPGGFALLPVIAWWQRHKRAAKPARPATRSKAAARSRRSPAPSSGPRARRGRR